MAEVAGRLAAVRQRIEKALADCGRAPGETALLAVSKTFPASAVQAFG
ncbi:MAG: YggS family pyridoxal phosphate-dependent enzyme, partial [Deltaproteobacteria bacterium]|nr:YggS family pyridoxal phosphate-dependent enzyme [Deltaproteobacteria bacterium]